MNSSIFKKSHWTCDHVKSDKQYPIYVMDKEPTEIWNLLVQPISFFIAIIEFTDSGSEYHITAPIMFHFNSNVNSYYIDVLLPYSNGKLRITLDRVAKTIKCQTSAGLFLSNMDFTLICLGSKNTY